MTIFNLDNNAVIKVRVTDRCNFKCPYCIRRQFITDYDYDIDPKEIGRIAYEMYCNTGKRVKIDLIGGEVTLYPRIQELVDELSAPEYIEKINITTNFELNPPTGNKLSLTASYHPTETRYTIEEWFKKCNLLKHKFRYFKVETVRTEESTHIDKFISLADRYSIDYMVEADLMNPNVKVGVTNRKRNPRYKIVFDDGTEKLYTTRNAFLKEHGIDGIVMDVRNSLCSKEFDFVYIEGDKVFVCDKEPVPIREYHPNKKWRECPRSICSLCGNISNSRNLL